MSARPGPDYPYVSTWPLIRAARALGASPLPARDGLRSTLVRAKRLGSLNVHAADRLAVHWLGLHPSEVWPDWWSVNADAAR